MAFNFPSNPIDGQLYPDPAVPGAQQYVYNATKGTWLTVFKGVERVTGNAPIFVSGGQSTPVVNIRNATPTESGAMTAADKAKLDSLSPSLGTVTSVTAGTGLGAPTTGQSITSSGTINLLPPSVSTIGGVKAGSGITIATDGTASIKPPSTVSIGGVKQGSGVSIAGDGTISLAPQSTYTVLDNLSSGFNGTKTSFQMTVGGIPFTPTSFNSLLVFVGGVIQPPLVGFTVSGANIIFSSAPPSGATFYGISLT